MRFHELKQSLKRTVAPEPIPVTIDEVKDELDIIDDSSVDTRINRLIREAVDIVERDSQRGLMSQTWQLWLDCFPCDAIELRQVPVTTAVVKYYASTVLTTWASTNYSLDVISEPARIVPVSGVSWPTPDLGINKVMVEFTAGYATAATVPHAIKNVVLYVIRQLYHGCELGDSYRALLQRICWAGYR
jgi:uncharacterized phiE125 gp8 family phage protein